MIALLLAATLAVYPRAGRLVEPVALSELIRELAPDAKSQQFSWDPAVLKHVSWTTTGIGHASSSSTYRQGLARVRVGGVTPTVLRRKKEELSWTVTMISSANENFGPTMIGVSVGAGEETECLGVGVSGCAYAHEQVFPSSVPHEKVCEIHGISGMPVTVYSVKYPGKSRVYARFLTDGGSGGSYTKAYLLLDKPPCSADW